MAVEKLLFRKMLVLTKQPFEKKGQLKNTIINKEIKKE
jgi:hypothetical protein